MAATSGYFHILNDSPLKLGAKRRVVYSLCSVDVDSHSLSWKSNVGPTPNHISNHESTFDVIVNVKTMMTCCFVVAGFIRCCHRIHMLLPVNCFVVDKVFVTLVYIVSS